LSYRIVVAFGDAYSCANASLAIQKLARYAFRFKIEKLLLPSYRLRPHGNSKALVARLSLKQEIQVGENGYVPHGDAVFGG
jgi:hypothetical protein